MVPRPAELLEGLQASGRAQRLEALKKVKNSVIGNKQRKEVFIKAGAVPQVIQLLSAREADSELLVQSAATLGSLVYGGRGGAEQTLTHKGLQAVLGVLVRTSEERVREAVVRCIKMICQAASVPTTPLLQPDVLACLVGLLSSPCAVGMAEGAACILGACCSSSQEQQILTDAGAVTALATHLHAWPSQSVHAALRLLSWLLTDNTPASLHLLRETPSALDQLTLRLREGSPIARALAASCISHLAAAVPQPVSAQQTSLQQQEAGTGSGAGDGSSSGSGAARVNAVLTRVWGAAVRSSPHTLEHRFGAPLFRLSGGRGSGEGRVVPGEPGGGAGGSAATATGVGGARRAAAVAGEGEGNRDVTMSPTGSPAAADMAERLLSAQRATIPVVLRLLEDKEALEVAGVTLATMLEDNEDLQRLATDAGAPRQLIALICNGDKPWAPLGQAGPTQPLPGWTRPCDTTEAFPSRAREVWLRALGSLCMAQDEARKHLLDSQVLRQIQVGLHDPECPAMRAAAALCILALTRNVKTLRCSPLCSGITQALCNMLSDKDTAVQVNVCAAICNLVLEMSSVKETLLDTGGFEALGSLAGSPEAGVRLYSGWAIRNCCHKSTGAVKRVAMEALGWPRMRSLLSDPSEAVQEQAVCILRNLCMDAAEHISSAFEWGGADLLAALEEKLDPSRQVPSALRIHALYILVNSLTGSESTKEVIMSSNIPALVCHHMRTSTEHEVRLPAVWCIINLAWASGPGPAAPAPPCAPVPAAAPASLPASPQGSGSGAAAGAAGAMGQSSSAASLPLESRLRRLRALGCHEALQVLLVDSNQDVRERAGRALELLRCPAGLLASMM